MKTLGFDEGDQGHASKIEGLDGKFWVWETLEEATRPHVDKLTPDGILRFFSAWAIQMKGSEEFHDLMHEKVSLYFA